MTKSFVIRFTKKVAVSLAALLATVSLYAGSFTLTSTPATYTNLLSLNKNLGSVLIKQIIITAGTANSNTSVLFIDSPTNTPWYTNAAYTNTISYATNITTFWTNFYGVVQTNTPVGSNLVLVDIANNIVPAGTNFYPIRFAGGASSGNSSTYVGAANSQNGLAIYFDNGVWVTNTSSGNAVITVLY
jgi:hypothetical protein